MAMNDFDDYADLNDGVTGDTIRSAADDPNENASVIAALASELGEDEQHVAGDIEGDIEAGTRTNPAQVQQDASQLAQAGYYAVGLLKQYASSVDTFDEGVEELNRRLRADFASARRWIGRSSQETDEDPPPESETWNNIRANLEPEYRDLNTAVDDSADDIAGKFEAGPTPENVKALVLAGLIPYSVAAKQWPDLTFTDDERRQALQNEVANMSAEEQAQWVRDNSDIGPDIADVISDEAQEMLAEDVATDIQDPENIDAETVRLLNLFKEQEAFAYHLYSDVTPEQMGDAIEHLNSEAFPTSGYTAGDEEDQELYKDFLTAAGGTLATYTKGTGAYAPPSNVVDTWYDAITKTDSIDHETGKPVNSDAAALTLLIRAGGQDHEYDPEFISELTDRVYDWERDQDGTVWGPRNDDPPIYDPFRDPEPLRDGRGNITGYSAPASDGLANLLGGMASSPEGSRMFFGDGDGGIDSGKLDYLIGEKDGDDVNARTFSADRASDEGEGLGQALEAAAVRDANDTSSHEWSGEFATDVFNRVADLSGHGNDWRPGDGVWHIWPNTADNLGNIAASYAPDVYDIVDGSGGEYLQVNQGDLDTVLGEIGRGDKSGIETLNAAIVLEGNQRLDDKITEWQEQNPGQPIDFSEIDPELMDILDGRSGTNGEILGHIINKAITVDEHDQSLAETRADYASKAIGIVGGFVPGGGTILGEGASHLATSAIDVGKSEGLDLLKNAVDGSPSATGAEWHEEARGSHDANLEHQVTNQLLNSGVLSVGDADHQIPTSLVVEHDDGSVSLNTDVFGPGGPDLTDPTEQIGEDGQYTEAEQQQMSDDLERWLRDSGSRDKLDRVTQSGQDGLDRRLNQK